MLFGNTSKLLLANLISFLFIYLFEFFKLSKFGNSSKTSFKESSLKKLSNIMLGNGSDNKYCFF